GHGVLLDPLATTYRRAGCPPLLGRGASASEPTGPRGVSARAAAATAGVGTIPERGSRGKSKVRRVVLWTDFIFLNLIFILWNRILFKTSFIFFKGHAAWSGRSRVDRPGSRRSMRRISGSSGGSCSPP